MKITESKLRSIIRSVIKETMHDDMSSFDPSAEPQHPDDLGLEYGTPEWDEAMDRYEEWEAQEHEYMRDNRPYEDGLSQSARDEILSPEKPKMRGYRQY